jgi:mannose-6-phosphate isomerase-like protein (cupin superfamily)
MPDAINLLMKFDHLAEPWQPRVIAEMNEYQFKIAKLEGDFVWHSHPETDEAFFVIEGELRIDLRDGAVTIRPGELYVVPRGV